MSPIDGRRIPTDVLLPKALDARNKLKCDPDKWNDYDIEAIRSACGVEWSNVSVANVRLCCSNLRKAGKLGTLRKTKNHGKAPILEPPTAYQEYLLGEHWREFRLAVLKGWSHRCCICYSDKALEVHHRTYERLGHEKLSDCVCLCSECHTVSTRALQRRTENIDAKDKMDLFN